MVMTSATGGVAGDCADPNEPFASGWFVGAVVDKARPEYFTCEARGIILFAGVEGCWDTIARMNEACRTKRHIAAPLIMMKSYSDGKTGLDTSCYSMVFTSTLSVGCS